MYNGTGVFNVLGVFAVSRECLLEVSTVMSAYCDECLLRLVLSVMSDYCDECCDE